MKGLPLLIKLARAEMDKRRKALAELEERRRKLEELDGRIKAEFEREAEIVAELPEAAPDFGSYAARIKKRREEIAAAVKALADQEEKAREKIAEIFGETKRYEIAEENARLREAQEEKRLEQAELDEIGARGKHEA